MGAATGALLVLFAHPNTRPGLLAPFRRVPQGGLARLLQRPPLPKPTDVVSGAAYLHAGAERLLDGPPLTFDERQTLLKIAAEGAQNEPENAFWSQARFVFGTGDEARRQWRLASRCRVYDDHQNAPLEEDRRRLAEVVGDDQAWTYAAVAPQRSESMARCILAAATRALTAPLAQTKRDEFACETIRNGAMLRDGSRRLKLGRFGIMVIEGATYPPSLALEATPHRLWSAKTALTGRLRVRGDEAEAALCDAQFRTNDAWQAFSTAQDPDARFQAFLLASVVAGVLPGALLFTVIAGSLVGFLGRRISRIAQATDRFGGPGLTLVSLTLLVGGSLLGYPLVGIAAGTCALVPGISPDRPRPFDRTSLGPLHAFVVTSMALALLGLTALVAISSSLPGRLLPQGGDIGAWFGDTKRLGAFVVVLLGASALVAPGWAVVRRYGTPSIAAFTYQNLGRKTASVGLAFAILLSPLSLAADRWMRIDLRRIEQNEQVYYNPSDSGEH